MVDIIQPARSVGSDNFWDSEIDYHVYAKRELAIGRKNINSAFGLPDTAASMREFEIRMQKARVLDRTRKQHIRRIRDQASARRSAGQVTRTIDGVAGKSDADIML